jgi:hypothetical protein
MGHSRPDTTQAYTDEVELDELAAALDRAAASRQAQASPDLTTLEEEVSDELETLRWRRRESNPRTIPTECRDRGFLGRPRAKRLRQRLGRPHPAAAPAPAKAYCEMAQIPDLEKPVRGAARRGQTERAGCKAPRGKERPGRDRAPGRRVCRQQTAERQGALLPSQGGSAPLTRLERRQRQKAKGAPERRLRILSPAKPGEGC